MSHSDKANRMNFCSIKCACSTCVKKKYDYIVIICALIYFF